jgi:catechol 2,3-dioxygenase-like lactoylglutathione lyase family enzyme
MIVERISAATLKVSDMARSVRFYNEILGLEVVYGGPDSSFTSLRTAGAQDAILNLEQGASSRGWGRLMAMVSQGWALLASLQLADVALGVAKFICQFLLAPATSDA